MRRPRLWEGSAIQFLTNFIDLILLILIVAIFVRALLSWIPNLDARNPFVLFVVQITEPVLAPFRAVIPRIGMMDISPMVALVVLSIVRSIIHETLRF